MANQNNLFSTAAPAQVAPSLVENGDLQRAIDDILERAERVVTEEIPSSSVSLTEAIEFLDDTGADLRELRSLVIQYRQAKLTATAARIVARAGAG